MWMRDVWESMNPMGLSGRQTGHIVSFEAQMSLMGLISKFIDLLAIESPKYIYQAPLTRWNYQNRKWPKCNGSHNEK